MTYPKIRIGVDWDNDGNISWGGAGDRPNLLPEAPRYASTGVMIWNNFISYRGCFYTRRYPTPEQLAAGVPAAVFAGGETPDGPTDINQGFYINTVSRAQELICDWGPTYDARGIPVTSSGVIEGEPYTVTYWVLSDDDTLNVQMQNASLFLITSPNVSYLMPGFPKVTKVATGAWRIDHTFTGPAYPVDWISIQVPLIPRFTDIRVGGFMLNAGAANLNYNATMDEDLPYAYRKENITPYVLSADWQLGTMDQTERISRIGTATIRVNNFDGVFLPFMPSASDLSTSDKTFILPNRRIFIEAKFDGVWKMMFSGYVRDIKPVVGAINAKEMTIEAETPIYTGTEGAILYDKIPLVIAGEVDPGTTTPDAWDTRKVLNMVAQRNAWRPATSPPGFRVGFSLVGVDTVLIDSSAYFTGDAEGDYVVRYVGHRWEDFRYADTLRAIVDTEHGWLMERRDGRIEFRNRSAFRNTDPADVVVNVGDIVGMVYSYHEDNYTSVNIPYRLTHHGAATIIPRFTGNRTGIEWELDTFEGYLGVRGDWFDFLVSEIDKVYIYNEGDGIRGLDGLYDQSKNFMYDSAGRGKVTPNYLWEYQWEDLGPNQIRGVVPHVGYFTSRPGGANADWDNPMRTYYTPDLNVTSEGSEDKHDPTLWIDKWDKKKIKLRFGTIDRLYRLAIWATIVGEIEDFIYRDQDKVREFGEEKSSSIRQTLLWRKKHAEELAKIYVADYGQNSVRAKEFSLLISDENSDTMDLVRDITLLKTVELNIPEIMPAPKKHLIIGERHSFSHRNWRVTYDTANVPVGWEVTDDAVGRS